MSQISPLFVLAGVLISSLFLLGLLFQANVAQRKIEHQNTIKKEQEEAEKEKLKLELLIKERDLELQKVRLKRNRTKVAGMFVSVLGACMVYLLTGDFKTIPIFAVLLHLFFQSSSD